ncbi:MAG: L-histidine N(alpha)-methyltransferase [Gaiellaceae bacterium]
MLTPDELRAQLSDDVFVGLGTAPRERPPKWFYDERGSRLFEEITRLPEYYLTRRERAILTERASAIASLSGADTLVELGSGTSEKTRLLLDTFFERGQLRRFVAVDVSREVLEQSAAMIASRYRSVEVSALVADFEQHLGQLPADGRRLVVFLGSTIGNLVPPRRAAFLSELAGLLAHGEGVLLGFDLVKPLRRLQAAYDDRRGVTAAFNRNVLQVLNDTLTADFVPARFDHVARFDPVESWMEMALRSRERQRVEIQALGLALEFSAGEELRTEVSCKFTLAGIERELAQAGLEPAGLWTDRARDFALCLASVP